MGNFSCGSNLQMAFTHFHQVINMYIGENSKTTQKRNIGMNKTRKDKKQTRNKAKQKGSTQTAKSQRDASKRQQEGDRKASKRQKRQTLPGQKAADCFPIRNRDNRDWPCFYGAISLVAQIMVFVCHQ